MEAGTYDIYEGGNDLYANEGGYLLVTDIIRGDQLGVEVIDFYIDEMGNGFIYFDGEEAFAQSNVMDYEALESIFYLQYTVEQINQ
jgi:hypothetical protein